jgi:Mg2+-importing ATPase
VLVDARHEERILPWRCAVTAAERYWALPAAEVGSALRSGGGGLPAAEAARRLVQYGPNTLGRDTGPSSVRLLLEQVRSPLVLILAFAGVVSFFAGDWTDGVVVLAILILSTVVGFVRERDARRAIASLRARLTTEAMVLRDGSPVRIAVDQLVPGDVVMLSAGSLVPADGVIWEATDLFVNEAVLTGETFPAEKGPGQVAPDAPLSGRRNCVFLGTNVRSGTARVLVTRTGAATAYGEIAGRLKVRPPETEFDRGIRQFGYLLTMAMTVLVIAVFAVNVLYSRPVIEALLFSVALAVGLSPELLPAILSVNLAQSARQMAARGVLVRRLAALENLGSMDVLCTDKTGTLTEGVVSVSGAFDPAGGPSDEARSLAVLNARLQTGLINPIDEALQREPLAALPEKLGEVPYDFVRKRLSVVVREGAGALLITKGAVEPLLAACTRVRGGAILDPTVRDRIDDLYRAWCQDGLRVIAVATRRLAPQPRYGREDERDMELAGFLALADRPKVGAAEAVADLGQLGVMVKVITGDHHLVAQHVARVVGLGPCRILTGPELTALSDDALPRAAEETQIFAEVDPNQKERIIVALRKAGHVVGFMGDGVNDAPAMHAADTSISVDGAVEVAREAADFVLLEKHLEVLKRGIIAGRTTFANTLKYILTTTSANLGNMISMAVASLFLPFLPLTAGQILLNNFLSDLPAMGLAGDSVDPELTERPQRWSMPFIRRFMIQFGLLSSLFDLLTFAVLLLVFRADPATFRTAWFVESLLTELAVALVVRTRRLSIRSRPGRFLLWSTVAVGVFTVLLPRAPGADRMGFVPLTPAVLGSVVAIMVAYVVATDGLKKIFYRRRAGDAGSAGVVAGREAPAPVLTGGHRRGR